MVSIDAETAQRAESEAEVEFLVLVENLLLVLVERPQRVLSRDQLLDLARGRAANAFDRSIDTQVSRLRKKLERDPAEPQVIKTIWGGGYMFTPAVTSE